MSDQKILLTQEWLAELLEKLRVLKEERRIEVAEKLKEAISFSDLSENAEYEKDGVTQEETYTIVGSQETNIFEKKISNESPIGKALIGKRVNDTVEVRAPSGVMKYTITLIQ